MSATMLLAMALHATPAVATQPDPGTAAAPTAAAEPLVLDRGAYLLSQERRRRAWRRGITGVSLLGVNTAVLLIDQGWAGVAMAWFVVPTSAVLITTGEISLLRGAREGAAATGASTDALRAARWSFWGGLGAGAALLTSASIVYQGAYSRRDAIGNHVDWFFPTVNGLLYGGGIALGWGLISPWVFGELQHRRNARAADALPPPRDLRVRVSPTPTGLALHGTF